MTDRHQVVILGGGLGGLVAAMALRPPAVPCDGSAHAWRGSLLALADARLTLLATTQKEPEMRLELGSRVDCADETFGKLVDVVIDPTSRHVTHLVAEPHHDRWLARLVPVELAERSDGVSGAVVLRATADEVRHLPPVHEVSYLRLDGFPVDDPDWDVGIEEVLALPYYPAYDLEPMPVDYEVTYDRIPKHEVEIRRASAVTSHDDHQLGAVDGFFVDGEGMITHLVLEQGHPWQRRDVAVPIGAVARVETDAVTLRLTRDEVAALPTVEVRRWPRPGEHGSRPH